MTQESANLNGKKLIAELLDLLSETIDSPPTTGSAYLDQKTGFWDTINSLSLEEAFAAPATNRPSIAAHLNHTSFHMRVVNEWVRGIKEKRDWQASFVVPEKNQAAWQDLQNEFRQQHGELKETMQNTAHTSEDAASGAVGALLHLAYHLGAIRQIMMMLRAK